jgi:hypothetical protein
MRHICDKTVPARSYRTWFAWLSEEEPKEEQVDPQELRQQIWALQVNLRPGAGKRPAKRQTPCHSSTPSGK